MRKSNAITLFVVLVVLSTLAPREGRANSGFVETVGISTAVGTVLGASTLPFYDSPGDHMINLAIGAGVGLVTGLGIWAFGRMGGASAELSQVTSQREVAVNNTRSHYTHVPYPKAPSKGLNGQTIWMPVASFQINP